MDLEAQLRQEYEEKKARLQAQFHEELEEHKRRLSAALDLEVASVREGSVRSMPPPPPPPAISADNLVLQDDLSNLPGRWTPLPRSVTFRGRVVTHPERVKLLFGFARLIRRVPGSVFSDPVDDVRDMLNRIRGDTRSRSPARQSRNHSSEPPRQRRREGSSRGRMRSPSRRSPPRSSLPLEDPLVERVRRLERCCERLSSENRKILGILRGALPRGVPPATSSASSEVVRDSPGKILQSGLV